MVARMTVVSVCLLAGAVFVGRASKTETVPIGEPLAGFPMQIGDWRGERGTELDRKILAVLRVDDYLIRLYSRENRAPVQLYIGYYQSQREGDTIHSPLNCLPGAGWLPIRTGRVTIPVQAASSGLHNAPDSIAVNRYEIQKGLDKAVVLYWYQSHGRMIASEYWGKVYLVLDAMRLNRTDAALVRVVAPVVPGGEDPENLAEQQAVAFVKVMFPLLGRYLPS